MTDRVDPVVDAMQAAHAKSTQDAVLVHAGSMKLTDGDDTVLPGSNPCHCHLCCGAFLAHIASKAPVAQTLPLSAGNL